VKGGFGLSEGLSCEKSMELNAKLVLILASALEHAAKKWIRFFAESML
jgi:hypothetical protein